MRIGPILLACALFAPAAARADVIIAGDFDVEWVTLDEGGGIDTFLSDLDVEEFFGNAACVCATETRLALRVKKRTRPTEVEDDKVLEIWSGETCNDLTDEANQANRCKEVGLTNPTLETVYEEQTIIRVDLPHLMFPDSDEPPCGTIEDDQPTVWLFSDIDTATIGYEVNENIGQISVDTAPPERVSNPTAKGVEEGVSITWDNPDSDED